LRSVHLDQPFHLSRLRKAATRKPHRLLLLKGVHQLLIQLIAVLLPRSLARSRELESLIMQGESA
ncbi:MAG TPA: hypothetical protein VFN02_02065, partial [Ktedonobacteraceae bacterium]|nr:hypothetical protein [Ktedonobacteraceae bacterium]